MLKHEMNSWIDGQLSSCVSAAQNYMEFDIVSLLSLLSNFSPSVYLYIFGAI